MLHWRNAFLGFEAAIGPNNYLLNRNLLIKIFGLQRFDINMLSNIEIIRIRVIFWRGELAEFNCPRSHRSS